MSTLFAAAFVATVALLVVIWLGPRVLCLLLNWIIGHYTKRLKDFEARRQESHAQIRTALGELQRYVEQRKTDR